jgi:hypothetical protein
VGACAMHMLWCVRHAGMELAGACVLKAAAVGSVLQQAARSRVHSGTCAHAGRVEGTVSRDCTHAWLCPGLVTRHETAYRPRKHRQDTMCTKTMCPLMCTHR